MQIRVLGCSGSIAAGSRTTSFLLGTQALVDAGTGVGDLTLDEMAAIEHIFVTHSHLDHVVSIGLLADSVVRRRRGRPPIVVHALPQTIEALRTHVFNGGIWPDFTRLPTPAAPILAFAPIQVGERVTIDVEYVIEALPAVHTVPALGYAVHGPSGAWVFTGDTGPNEALWTWAARHDVKHLVIETAFGDDEAAVAAVSAHLCPSLLAVEFDRMPASCRHAQIHITHIKPGEVDAVMRQVQNLARPLRIRALQAGDRIDLDPAIKRA
jgi:ribonuclease BN (tRNA processing enzyme)